MINKIIVTSLALGSLLLSITPAIANNQAIAGKTGRIEFIDETLYLFPYPLSSITPSLVMDAKLRRFYAAALNALKRLNALSDVIPDLELFVKSYVIKDALLNSSINNPSIGITQVLSGEARDDFPKIDLINNYIPTLNAVLKMVKAPSITFSDIILEIHKMLIPEIKEEGEKPGYFRKMSVQLGEYPLLPPPAPEVPALIASLGKYWFKSGKIPPLIKSALVHFQFESIHPFLDGNGRVGHLLIVVNLLNDGLLKAPILYPGYYLNNDYDRYAHKLRRVTTQCDLQGWLRYYLQAIQASVNDAYLRAQAIIALKSSRELTINHEQAFAKSRKVALQLLNYLFQHPITSVKEAGKQLKVSDHTIQDLLTKFAKHKIVSSPLSSQDKKYYFTPYLNLLAKEYVIKTAHKK